MIGKNIFYIKKTNKRDKDFFYNFVFRDVCKTFSMLAMILQHNNNNMLF